MKNEIEQKIFEKMKAKDFGESMSNETKLNVLRWTMQQLRKHDVSGSVTYQGVTYKRGDKVVSPNGYEFFVVTDEGRWGLVDHGGTFCELQDCDLTGYLHCH